MNEAVDHLHASRTCHREELRNVGDGLALCLRGQLGECGSATDDAELTFLCHEGCVSWVNETVQGESGHDEWYLTVIIEQLKRSRGFTIVP
jgi:hypothetical protein